MTPEGIGQGIEWAQAVTDTADLLRPQLQSQAIIRSAKPITLRTQAAQPEPDIAVVEPIREIYRTSHHPYPENIYLLIEYSYSSLDQDQTVKRLIYAQAGIREYWIVNLKDRQVIVYRDPTDGDYRSVTTLTSGSISLLAFPDVTIAVAELI